MAFRHRTLASAVQDLAFDGNKVALISGPRQCGKTTLARMLLKPRRDGVYWNWDEPRFRRRWIKDPATTVPERTSRKAKPLVVYDEIHKDRRWKRTLKGIYDTLESPCDLLVTGSARLDVYKRGSDSLLGRNIPFRMHPFSLREMRSAQASSPDQVLQQLFSSTARQSKQRQADLKDLLAYGPFPEPLIGQNIRRARIWRRTRSELIIREDLRDLSRLPELARIEMLATLLPPKVSGLLSIQSLAEDLEVAHQTVSRWLEYLERLYYVYEIKPWYRQVPRSLRKAGKLYFLDFAEITNEGARFENLVANHLLKACDYWTETGEGTFALHFLRDKEKREVDFLIVRDGKPWLPVECKLRDSLPSNALWSFMKVLRLDKAVQITREPGRKLHKQKELQVLVVDAARSLQIFP